jgi:hypothetical protein
MKKRYILCFLALLSVVSVLGFYGFLADVPSYEGRGLSSWLKDFDVEKREKRPAAEDALRHIGPKAVPFLVRRLEHTTPNRGFVAQQWKEKIFEFWAKYSGLKIFSARPADLRHQGLAGLDALGPAGQGALPALERMLQEVPPVPQVLYVAARLGEAGEPLLRRALTNEERVIRLEASICLEMIKERSDLLYPEAKSSGEVACY